jgi:hypothetical protein
MTRERLRSHLDGTFAFIGGVLAIAFFARFAYPLQAPDSESYRLLLAAYEYLRDMSLLIATGGVAYLTNVYQKRASFIDALREEWRDILKAKSALLAYTQLEQPVMDDYIVAFHHLSETIDNMRTVYRNVGETREKLGIYPFEPLHDMRRAFQTLSPKKAEMTGDEQRKLVRDAILQSFYALRDRFLDELDLEEPTRPVMAVGARRMRQAGSAWRAERWRDRQQTQLMARREAEPPIDAFLRGLREKEDSTPKPWREMKGAG